MILRFRSVYKNLIEKFLVISENSAKNKRTFNNLVVSVNSIVPWKCVEPIMGCGISSTVDNMNEEISAITHRNGMVRNQYFLITKKYIKSIHKVTFSLKSMIDSKRPDDT